MWPCCAPTALRMPISRVRSVTVTSMMFITPMPPTSSEIAATAPSSSREDVARCCSTSASSDPWFSTLSDAASVAVNRFSAVIVSVTSVAAWSVTVLESACTVMLVEVPELPVRVSCTAV